MIGSTITAVHPQRASITDKSSSYTIKMTDEEYLIDGYETFDVGGQYTMNCYVEMLMYSPGNSGDNRNKICVDTTLSV